MIAALYDIHGNAPALDAVLAEIEELPVSRVVVGGDVLPGPMPDACLERLATLRLPVDYLYGNGERDVLALLRGEPLTRVPEAFHPLMRWVAGQLTPGQRETLARWPATVRREVAGVGSVLFCHATPRDDNELVTAVTAEERLVPVFESVRADVVVCGHTHMQFDRHIGATRVVNAGSVGMPFGEPGAYWALIGAGVELRRTAYDLEAAASRILTTDYPQAAEFPLRHPPSARDMVETFEAAALRGPTSQR